MPKPLRVVLDTNIFISAIIHPGRVRDFLLQLLVNQVSIVISNYIIWETEQVLQREKFPDKVIFDRLWDQVKNAAVYVQVLQHSSPAPALLRDPRDHPILKTAQQSGAQFIITGDKDLITLKSWQNINILTIKEFHKFLITHSVGGATSKQVPRLSSR